MSVKKLIAGKGHDVPTIRSDTTLQNVIDQLGVEDAGALVVTDDEQHILGIITERDIVRGLKSFGRDVVDKPVQDLMTRDVIVCDIGEPLTQVLRLMDTHRIQYLPVTKDGLLHGIINMLDLVKYRLHEVESEASALKEYVTRV